jgi:hypothetical protein
MNTNTEFCEQCQCEMDGCAHQKRAAWVKNCRDRAWDNVIGSKYERLKGTSRWCEEHHGDILDCCVPAFKAAQKRRYARPGNKPAKPCLPRKLGELFAETAHWVTCPCGIRHEPPVCCQPGESLDEL